MRSRQWSRYNRREFPVFLVLSTAAIRWELCFCVRLISTFLLTPHLVFICLREPSFCLAQVLVETVLSNSSSIFPQIDPNRKSAVKDLDQLRMFWHRARAPERFIRKVCHPQFIALFQGYHRLYNNTRRMRPMKTILNKRSNGCYPLVFHSVPTLWQSEESPNTMLYSGIGLFLAREKG